MSNLIASDILYSYSNGPVLNSLSIELIDGEITCLIGESGAGKTTLLRIIAGLEKQISGEIRIGNQVISNDDIFIDPHKRQVGLVVQERALFPHLKIIDNICFGLHDTKINKKSRAKYLMKSLKLKSMKIHTLMKSLVVSSKVSLARALAPSPKILLMDEPFSSIDRALKVFTKTRY